MFFNFFSKIWSKRYQLEVNTFQEMLNYLQDFVNKIDDVKVDCYRMRKWDDKEIEVLDDLLLKAKDGVESNL